MNDSYDYTQEDISYALVHAGIRYGDTIFIHSNIGYFGRLKDAVLPQDYYKAFKTAIIKVIGPEGTLVVPAFSYSFCWGKPFDRQKTPGVCGFLSEQVRQDPESIRSDDANFSVAAIGKNAQYLTENAPEYSFGPGSFWERFHSLNGIICNFNFDAGSTFIHYVERSLHVPYRSDKRFEGIAITGNISQKKDYYHFVYDLEKPGDEPEFSRFDAIAKERGIAKVADLGKGQIVSISSQDTLDLIRDIMAKNPRILLKDIC
jgi:aminoglycoside 3-N-acetyltransferase